VNPVVIHLDTERGWRGGERQVLWLARELDRLGCRSWVAARPGQPLIERARQEGIATLMCRPRFETDPVAALRLRRFMLSNGVQILHAHTGHAVGLGALATLGTDIALVASRRVSFRLRGNVVTRWKYRRASAIIAISEPVARVLAAGGIPRGKIDVVPDGTDTTRIIRAAERETLAALGLPANGPLVVQVSQLGTDKDPLTFVRAIAVARRRVAGLRALLVGDGPLRHRVEAERDALGLAGTLAVAGYRDDADSLLATSDVVTLSSRDEGMGSVLLDAMLLGKPIVATRAGGIPELVEDGVTGMLVPIGDPDALGDAIAGIAGDPARAARLGAAGRGAVERFSVTALAGRTLEIYRRVLGNSPTNSTSPIPRSGA
jgi:L-malate glycosyltransferase